MCKIVHKGCFGLETRRTIKISTHMIPHMKAKVVFIRKKTIMQKFHGLVLSLVGLSDAKGIGVAQLIWS